jgi:hypothetical protein
LSTRSPTPWIHWVAGAIACFGVPVASWVEGAGQFAWTMYSRTGEYRIDVTAFDARGSPRPVNPTALAEHSAPSAAALLAGSDHWRGGPTFMIRAHLRDLAGYACGEEAADAIEVTLHERNPGSEEQTTSRRVGCRP